MGDSEGKISNHISKPDVNNGVHGSHSVTAGKCSSKESSSGFMLLSVKHLSKVKRSKHLSTAGMGNDPLVSNHAEMRSTLPLPTLPQTDGCLVPQSSMCEDNLHDTYGSGSIEAEEFEDFDDQEDDADLTGDGNPIRNINVVGHNSFSHFGTTLPNEPSIAANFCQLHFPTVTQSFTNPLNGHFQSPVFPGKKFTSTCNDAYQPKHSDRLSSPVLMPSLNQSGKLDYLQPFQNKCIYPPYPQNPCYPGFFNSDNSDAIPSTGSPLEHDNRCIAPEQKHLNINHLLGRRITSDSHDCTDISDLSPSKLVCTMASHNYPDPPNTSSDWMKLSGVLHPTYHAGLSPRSRHGSFTQPAITCLHHLHPSTTSDNAASTASTNNHLTSDAVAKATASLPPLQPASRFRKARIHETVEQWSCGRFSVHDCHLKAVPDWVNELHKKSLACEDAISNLPNRKTKCLSCFIPKTVGDTSTTMFPRSTQGFAHLGVSVDHHSDHTHQKLGILDNALEARSIILSHGSQGNNLFSFWNDGLRVRSQIPSFARVHVRNSEPIYDACDNCDCPILNSVHSECKIKKTYTENSHNGHHGAINLSSRENGIEEDSTELTDGSPILLGSSDPATAYLRRKHMGTTSYAESLSVATDSKQRDDSTTTASPQQPLKNISPLRSDFIYMDSKEVLNHSDGPGYAPNQEMCLHEVSSAPSSNVPPASPSAAVIVTNTDRIPLGLQTPSEISMSKLRLLDLVSTDENNLGPDYANVNLLGSNVQRLINEGTSTANKDKLEDNSRTNHVSPGDFHLHTSPRKIDFRLRSSGRRSKSFDDSFCVNSLDRIKSNKLYNSDIVRRSRAPLTVEDVISTASPKGFKFPSDFTSEVECNRNSRTSSLLSDRLEARIRASMEAIRSTLVNSFRDELATVLAENVNLRSEITRLNSELTLLRSYQHAFFAIRPFVPPSLWENICVQQGLPVSPLMNGADCQPSCDPQNSR
ncbi:unnamed protein product [Trichobilharzia szidati]|nr:unnamed protein product [Trichobilharzia szidati]